ncbi:MAG: ribonuclease HI family protein [Dehalococcoidia bacterium]|nr:ribonuclease HI family protein [Dehalococcoidia bacterium]
MATAEGCWVVYTDGASRGNPGPAAIGVVIFDDKDRECHRISEAIGRATNNEAEYRAAIAGLEAALALGARDVELRMDSELVVRQLDSSYRVRNPRLKRLFARMEDLRWRFASFRATAIPRQENALADKLANEALDRPGG